MSLWEKAAKAYQDAADDWTVAAEALCRSSDDDAPFRRLEAMAKAAEMTAKAAEMKAMDENDEDRRFPALDITDGRV